MKNYYMTLALLLVLVISLTGFVFMVQGEKEDRDQLVENLNGAIDGQVSLAPKIRENMVGEKKEEQIEFFKPEITTATIGAVGDILIHSSLYKDAHIGNGEYDFTPMFEYVKPYISNVDIAFANQETILGGKELGLTDYPRFNSPFEVGEALIDTGIDVVSIANNHTLDRGEQAILNAINYYHSNKLIYTGGYKSVEDRAKIRVIECNGITFSFLAYTFGTNGISIPSGKEYLVNIIDLDVIKDEITRAKQASDVVTLSLHFGNEYELLPNKTQKMLALEFANAGADIILGHHPHVLQPFEWIEREDGKKTFVAYSLGNFLSGQIGIEREIGGFVQLEVEKETSGEEVSIKLQNPKFLATYAYKKNWRNFKIYPLQDINDDNVLKNAKGYLQNIKEHVSQTMPDLQF